MLRRRWRRRGLSFLSCRRVRMTTPRFRRMSRAVLGGLLVAADAPRMLRCDIPMQSIPAWEHGVYEEGVRIAFPEGWVFPHGSNHLSSVEVMAWGEGGSFTWPIPVTWRCRGDDGVTNVFCYTDQRFELDADGTVRVIKFGYCGERTTNNVFTLTRISE